MKKGTAIFLFALCFFFGAQVSRGQDDPPIKVKTVLLNIPVFVTDKSGKPVEGLKKDDFEMFLAGQRQKIDYFADKGPLTVAIMIDSNSNTSGMLDKIKRDAQDFIDLLGPDDKAMVIKFDLGYRVLCDLTSDRGKLKKAVASIDSNESRIRIMDMVLHQAIFYYLVGVSGRKAVMIFGDPDSAIPGNLNSDVAKSPGNPQNFLPESDVTVYPIFYLTPTFPREFLGRNLTIDQLAKIPPVDNYNAFAMASGGRLYAAGASNFKTAFERIVDELRSQYVLSFELDGESEGKPLNILIKTSNPDLSVRTRQRAYAASPDERKRWVARYMVGRRP